MNIKISEAIDPLHLHSQNSFENTNILETSSSTSGSETDFSDDEDDSNSENSKTNLLTSLRQINYEPGLRPKAFFFVLTESLSRLKYLGYENLDLNSLSNHEELLFVTFNSNKQSITIGKNQKMDLVIDKKFFNSKTRIKKCNCISDNHACVFYHISTNTFELVNYSKYGTSVDNFCYSSHLQRKIFLYSLKNISKNLKFFKTRT